jgi:hypothetical protein
MAKKQTRRSISVSRATYERLKSYCETNQISMSQFVERRVGDYLGRTTQPEVQPAAEVPSAPARPVSHSAMSVPPARPQRPASAISQPLSTPVASSRPRPTRKASDEPLVKDPDVKLTADQIFTF